MSLCKQPGVLLKEVGSVLSQPKHTGWWEGARTREDGAMGNWYSWLSHKPLGRWTKVHNYGDMTFSVEMGSASRAQTAKRRPGDNSECVRLGGLEAASDDRWDPEFWAGIRRQKFGVWIVRATHAYLLLIHAKCCNLTFHLILPKNLVRREVLSFPFLKWRN